MRAGPEIVSAKERDVGKSVAAAIVAARASVRAAVQGEDGRDVGGRGWDERGRGLCEAVGTKAIWKASLDEMVRRVECWWNNKDTRDGISGSSGLVRAVCSDR